MFNRRVITMALLAVIAFGLAGAAWGIRAYGLRSALPPGMELGGMPMEGMTYGQAAELLRLQQERTAGRSIRFNSDKPAAAQAVKLQQTGFRLDVSQAELALKQLQEGSPFRRAWNRWQLRNTKLPFGIVCDEAAYRSFVTSAWAELSAKQPVAAKRSFSPQDQPEIIPDIPVYRVDGDRLLGVLRAVDWLSDLARVTAEPPTAPGQTQTPQTNNKSLPEVTIELPLTEVRSPVTAQSLADQGIQRKISQFSTPILPGSEGRFHNVASTALILQDRLLGPGEVFDYATVVKETETRYGFQEAPVIYNGKLVPGVGGGICQVSSTLYNAVLRAGLEIVERRNHSLPVSYVPLGQDATYSDGYINFRFRNSSDAFILVRTVTESNKLTVKIFGNLPASVTYEIESFTLQELAAPVKTVINPKLQPGQKETLQKGKPGYVVETYRTKKDNGVILSRELLSKDRYQPQPTLVAVGGSAADSSPPSNSNGILEDGVSGPRFN